MMKKIIAGGFIVVAVLVGVIVLNQPKNENTTQSSPASTDLIPVSEITHGHGLAVDVADSSKVYIATHHGLLLLINDKDLYQVGEKKDDYMGFSPHPSSSKVFFSSGHPSFGGNIGFQITEDNGFTWKKLSDGVNGPVDFHAMTVSPVNPDLIFGSYQGAIQASMDGGKNWTIVGNTSFVTVGVTADSKDENIVYAASPQGLFISKNKGASWDRILEGFVSAIAVHPQDSQMLLSFSEKQRLAKSVDGGKAWEKINEGFNSETPLFIAFNRQMPETVYALTEKNSLYKSIDTGSTWSKIR